MPAPLSNLGYRKGLGYDVLVLRSAMSTVSRISCVFRFGLRQCGCRASGRTSPSKKRWDAKLWRLAMALHHPKRRAETFLFGRYLYVWGDDTLTRTAFDVFRAGVGECAAVNNLVGTLLEMNGLRFRIVSGFSPKFRVIFATGGHSAIEVADPKTGNWSYVDAYLGSLLPGTSVERLARGGSPSSRISILSCLTRLRRPNLVSRRIFGRAIQI